MSALDGGALRAILAATILALPLVAGAQSGVVAPRPLSQQQPPQVTNSAARPVGGWAVVRYSVMKDGTTSNVRVIAAVPPAMDTSTIKAAAEGWTFSPATSDGAAIDWHNGETVVNFADPPKSGASTEFTDAYAAISQMMDVGQLREAQTASRDLLNESATQKSELAVALTQSALIAIDQSDPDTALTYLQLASDPRAAALSGADMLLVLEHRFRVETALGRAREAIATYERLAAGLDPGVTDPFADVARQLRAAWQTSEFLEVIGKISDEPWRFDVGRRFFYIDNIKGEIDAIDVECDTRRLSIDFQADADYQLPDSFGACTLFIKGTPGTEFSYIGALPPSE